MNEQVFYQIIGKYAVQIEMLQGQIQCMKAELEKFKSEQEKVKIPKKG